MRRGDVYWVDVDPVIVSNNAATRAQNRVQVGGTPSKALADQIPRSQRNG